MSIPARTSTTGKDHTVTIVYDQPLKESSPPLTSDYGVSLGGVPLTVVSVIVLNVGGFGRVMIGTTQRFWPGILSIPFFTPGRLMNEAGELAPFIAGEQIVNATVAADIIAPGLLAARLNGGGVELYFDEVLDPASIPLASAFTIEGDDGAMATVDPVAIYGVRATIPLVDSADAGDTASLTYTPPGAGNLRDIAGPNDVAAIAFPIALDNVTTEQSGYWTTRTKVENRWGEDNTRIWSNKGDSNTTDADPIAWRDALDRTDSKFNVEFAMRGFPVPPYAVNSTSPFFAEFKFLAASWAGSELYFSRGQELDSDTTDKLEAERKRVNDRIIELFGSIGFDVVVDGSETVSGGTGIVAVQPDCGGITLYPYPQNYLSIG